MSVKRYKGEITLTEGEHDVIEALFSLGRFGGRKWTREPGRVMHWIVAQWLEQQRGDPEVVQMMEIQRRRREDWPPKPAEPDE